jgi:hypothetical protein
MHLTISAFYYPKYVIILFLLFCHGTTTDPSAWQCNPMKHTSDTRAVAVASLGISGASTLFGLLNKHLRGHQFHSNKKV